MKEQAKVTTRVLRETDISSMPMENVSNNHKDNCWTWEKNRRLQRGPCTRNKRLKNNHSEMKNATIEV